MAEKVEITIQAHDAFSKVFGKASFQLKQLGDRAKQVGKNLSLKLTVPLLGVGAAVLTVAASFEKSMNKVQAVTRASAEEMAAMEKIARELGATTQFSAREAAEGLTFLSMAGFSAKESIAALPAVLDLAAASNEQLGFVADKVSNIMTQFGIDASETSRVTDILTETFTTSNTSMAQLADAMVFAGSVAGTFGISLEETSAALGILADSGKQASLGGTALRGMLTKLLAPTSQAAEIMSELGINVVGTDNKLVSITEIIKQFENSAVTAGEVMTIFGQRAGPGMLDLLKVGSAALEENTQKLKESGGRAKEVADVQMKGLTGALKEMKSALEELALSIAESGLLEWATSLMKGIAGLIRVVAEGNPKWFKLGVVLAGVAAAAGPLLIAIGLLVSPIGLIVAAIVGTAGLIAAIVIFREEIGEKITSVITGFMTILGNARTAVKNFAISVGQGFTDAMVVVKQFLVDIDEFLLGGLRTIIDTAGEIVKGLLTPFEWLAEQVVGGSVVPDMVEDVLGWFGKMEKEGVNIVDAMAKEILKAFKEIDENNPLKGLADAGAGVVGPVTGAVNGVAGVSGAIQGFEAGGPIGAAAGFLAELILKNEAMQEVLAKISEVLIELVDPIAEAIAPVLEAIIPILKELAPVFKVIGKAVGLFLLPIALLLKAVAFALKNVDKVIKFVVERLEAVTKLLAGTIAEPLIFVGEQLELTAVGVKALEEIMGVLTPTLSGLETGINLLVGIGNSLFSIVEDLLKPIEALKQPFEDINKPMVKIAEWIKKFVKAVTGGGLFAHGGRPPLGAVSVVGERGPELFVPDRPGTIIPNDQLGGMGSVTININAVNRSPQEIARMLEEMALLGRFNLGVA